MSEIEEDEDFAALFDQWRMRRSGIERWTNSASYTPNSNAGTHVCRSFSVIACSCRRAIGRQHARGGGIG